MARYILTVQKHRWMIPETMKGSFGPYQVPEDCYFMLGDNRNNSKDSRYWKNTYVRFDQIVGKAVIRYYPSIKLVQGL